MTESDLDVRTLILMACSEGNVSKVRLLLEADPALVQAIDARGRMPLHRAAAAIGDQVEIVELLLSSGADIQARDYDGWTPMQWADFFMNRDVIELLTGSG